MLANHLVFAYRNLWRKKFYSVLNIAGLAIGLAVCMIIVFYVRHEFTYDSHHQNAERIIRITTKFETPDKPMVIASTPVLLASYLNKDYPEIENTTRLQPSEAIIKCGEKLQDERDVYFSEPSIFKIFSFKFLDGTAQNALTRPGTVVLTRSCAEKYFGEADCLGQTIQVNKAMYEVTGIVQDLPSNSDMRISALLSRNFLDTKEWLTEDFPVYTFALFKNTPDLKTFGEKLQALCDRNIQPELKAQGADGYKITFETEALQDVHYSQGKMGDTPKGSKQYGFLFSLLALFVLAIAILNYINLLIATSMERSREVGIRKANGAQRRQLILQFLSESFILTCLAIVGAMVILKIAIPLLNILLGIQIVVSVPDMLALASIGTVAITILGGLYPSFALSAFKPINALKGSVVPNGYAVWFRKSITVFQFSHAVAMVFGVLVINQQMNFLRNHNLGFDKDQLLVVSAPDDSAARSRLSVFATMLKRESKIHNVTLGTDVMQLDATYPYGTTLFKENGKKKEVISSYFFVDEHFISTLSIKLLQGRNFSDDIVSDKKAGFIVNEAFVKMSGWKNPLGEPIEGFFHKGEVIGVVRNFNYRSLHNAVEPLVMVYNTRPPTSLTIKTEPGILPVIEREWKTNFPDFPLHYRFLDASYEAQYSKDNLMMSLFKVFCFLTVFVSCLGLLSLVTFSTNTRTKEIGVRKILGASVEGILSLLTMDYLSLIILAIGIASPIAWYAMDIWLHEFAYHIQISGWSFLIAAMIAIAIALATITFHTMKAALRNPVESLKSES